jgi:hypothetical protein
MNRVAGYLVVASWLALPAVARADDGVSTDLEAEERIARALWAEHREGPHMYIELGSGALYAPEMPFTFGRISEVDDALVIRQEGLVGPMGILRWGVNFGVTRGVDLRVGVGSFFGGAILEAGDEIFAYPHAIFDVSFGPGDVYRARVGVVTGALILARQEAQLTPQTAQYGLHGEVSPLVLRLGETRAFELSVTQGLGFFLRDETSPPSLCATAPTLGGCVPRGSERVVFQFAGHTMAAFGAVLD